MWADDVRHGRGSLKQVQGIQPTRLCNALMLEVLDLQSGLDVGGESKMKFHRPDMASTENLQDTASWSQNLGCLTWGLARQLEASGVSNTC